MLKFSTHGKICEFITNPLFTLFLFCKLSHHFTDPKAMHTFRSEMLELTHLPCSPIPNFPK